jgi:hypothetical protein
MVGACKRIAARGRTTILLAALCAAAFAAGTFTFAPGVARCADAVDNSKALADYLIAQTTHPGGGVALPRCGDGRLAAALADRADGPLVYAADARDAQYDAARKLAADAGRLGRTLYVQKASLAQLPLADNYADLVVLTDLTDADLKPAAGGAPANAQTDSSKTDANKTDSPPSLLGEIQRILVPLNGRAVVGRAKSATGGGQLTRAALEAWAKTGGTATDVKIVDDAQGLWAVFGRPAIAGVDDWTHWFHGPDNNPLSSDKAFTAPQQVGWLAKPYHLPRSLGGRGAARGRVYMATGAGSYQGDWAESFTWELFAFNAYNGRLLWKQP